MENGIQLMFDLSEVTVSPQQTAGVSVLPVRTSQLPGKEPDSVETEVHLSEKCSGSLKKSPKKIVPNGLSTKMLRECLAAIEGGDFGAILLEMGELGYDTEWQLFNTKNFGVPQNRERVYTVGHLRSRGRKQIFPLKGADGEDSVHEVTTSVIGGIGEINFGKQFREGNRVYDGTKIATALKASNVGNAGGTTNLYSVPLEERIIANCVSRKYDNGVSSRRQEGTAVAIPVLTPDRAEKRQNGRRFKENGDESFTLTAQDRHGVGIEITPIGGVYTSVAPAFQRGVYKNCFRGLKAEAHDSGVAFKVEVKEATKQGYAIAHEGDSINLSMPNSQTRRDRVGDKVAQTLDCSCNQGVLVKLSDDLTVYAVWYEKYQCYIAIRKLTPRECFRLQGWTDDYFEKAAFVNSDSQLYKQAGNGVTVDVVYEIAKQLSV